MDKFEAKIKHGLECAISGPDDGLRERLMQSAEAGVTVGRAKPRPVRKVVMAAVAAMLLSATTIFAMESELIERITVRFGLSTAQSVEIIQNEPGITLAYGIDWRSSEFNLWPESAGYALLHTVEEARQVMPFEFIMPTFLPDYLELNRITVQYTYDGRYLYSIAFNFEGGEVPNLRHLFFQQEKVGPWARITLQTIGGVETIMFGDVEALGISHGGVLSELIFIADGVFYHLSGRLEPGDLLAIAESIHP